MTRILSASALAAEVAQKRVTAVAVIDDHLKIISDRNFTLNAIVTLDDKRARTRAFELDASLARGEAVGPLSGVPVTIKDCYEIGGLRTTAGFPPLASYVGEQTATVVSRIEAAGGIVIGKTNVAPLAFGSHTNNPVFGCTLNPFSDQHSPGGSSGGSAAAVAAGFSCLDLGSDATGSIRIPAAFCGVYGFKPSAGRIPLTGHVPPLPQQLRLDRWLSVPGIIARSVADVSLAAGLLVGPDQDDYDIVDMPFRSITLQNLHGIRVAWSSGFPNVPVDDVVKRQVHRYVDQLALRGAHVEECLPKVDFERQQQLLLDVLQFFSQVMNESTTELGRPSAEARELLRLLSERDIVAQAWGRFFREFDLFVCPVTSTSAFRLDQADQSLTVNGAEVEHWWIDRHCFQYNIAGCPAISVPCGLNEEGLPLAVQVASGRWRDEFLLAVVAALESESIRGLNAGARDR
jgi:amidase